MKKEGNRLVHNEKGFTYPLTFLLVVLFSLFLAYFTEQYISEKRVFSETEKILQQEYYLVHAVKTIEAGLQRGDLSTLNGIMTYLGGEVSYAVVELSDQLLQMKFDGLLVTNEQWGGEGLYDIEAGKMIKWVERR